MYKLEILPTAKEDMVDIVRYISRELKNPEAAGRLAEELFEAMENVKVFPYSNPVHVPIRPLQFEYRKLMVKNYMLLYRVDERNRVITIARAVYSKRDYEQLVP